MKKWFIKKYWYMRGRLYRYRFMWRFDHEMKVNSMQVDIYRIEKERDRYKNILYIFICRDECNKAGEIPQFAENFPIHIKRQADERIQNILLREDAR